ncbi:MAG: SulP family inorganic anion transporter [Alphaproteobacteria bacterium]|nr:MAG: SulP family inorganic anion transporter [Alphaproteobacteria bacterium]
MSYRLSSLKGDIFGGLTAAVVALPLALAFGVASGLGPIAGLYGAIATGFFAAIFGGTPAQVSGPTGPMTIVTAAIVSQYADNLTIAFTIVFLGGVLQLLFGALKVGRYVSYTPYSVISGFMSGIGIIIIIMQVLPFLGLPATQGGPIGAIRSLGAHLEQWQQGAAILGIVSLGTMVFWPTRLRTILPPPLAALLIGTLLALTIFTDAPILGSVPTGLPQIFVPHFSAHELVDIIQPAFVLALLGSIDSLLTSLVADTVTRTHHNSDRELIGQGIGNMVAGLIGAIPGAGATMRTVINVRAGGHSPLSGALHAVVLLSLALGLGPLVEKIPNAVLAGILIKVGWDIIDWGYLRRLRKAPREKVFVMFVTLGLTVFVDLITAVAVGLILAGFVTARWMEREELKGITALAISDNDTLSTEERTELSQLHDQVLVIAMRGRFSYASARELTRRIGVLTAGYKGLVLDFSEAAQIDTSAAMAIEEVISAASTQNIILVLTGLAGEARETLENLDILKGIPLDNIVDDPLDAIRRVGQLIHSANAT